MSSIDRPQPLSPVSSVRPRENSVVAAKISQSASGKKSTNDIFVKLSNAQAELLQPDSQDINTQRVKMLKDAILNGKLSMNTEGIADALLKNTADYLAGKEIII